MSDEFLNGRSPLTLEMLFISHDFHLIHKTVNILDQNVIAGDKHLLLLALISRFISVGLICMIRARILHFLSLILNACQGSLVARAIFQILLGIRFWFFNLIVHTSLDARVA